MNLVDSCGWLEFGAGGPNTAFFEPALQDRENLLVPTICIFEVFRRVLQQRGRQAALETAAEMQEGVVVGLDDQLAVRAAQVSGQMRLPMADAIILATARAHDAVVWTQDAHFEGIEGVRYTSAV